MGGNFKALIERRFELGAYLCVGLDPTPEERRTLHNPHSVGHVVEYLVSIVEATNPYAAAFKPNRAFYEGMGTMGDEVLERLIEHIRLYHPDIPVILDNKLGDIAATNKGYVTMANRFRVNALTLHPYLGSEGMMPFLNEDRYSFVLCKTSNPGSDQFQDITVRVYEHELTGSVYVSYDEYVATQGSADGMMVVEMPLYLYVARRVMQDWQMGGGAGLVVGATYPKHLKKVLEAVAGMVILVPGVGTQGGDPSEAFAKRDDNLVLVSASSSVARAPDPAEAAFTLNAQIEEWMMA